MEYYEPKDFPKEFTTTKSILTNEIKELIAKEIKLEMENKE